jgi:hypothetical protein
VAEGETLLDGLVQQGEELALVLHRQLFVVRPGRVIAQGLLHPAKDVVVIHDLAMVLGHAVNLVAGHPVGPRDGLHQRVALHGLVQATSPTFE